MNINKKGFANVILVVIIIVLVVVAGYFVLVKKSVPNTTQQTPNNTTANWKTYQNGKYHFTLQIPENLVVIPNIDRQGFSNVLFINQNDLKKIEKIPRFKTDPLHVTIVNDTSGLLFSRSTLSGANSTDADIKSYLSSPAHSQLERVLKQFPKVTGKNGQTIYFYTISYAETSPAKHDITATWISRGTMYTLTNLSRSTENLPSKEMLLMIAESFVEVK